MAALAEDSVDGVSTGRRVRNILIALIGMAVVGYGGYWLKSQFSKPSGPTRQVTKISIIPDTPPPPPPPPKEEKRPEPKEQKEAKVEQPKPVEAPPQQAEQLKMEGAAGDGPSPFAAGSVTNEYRGGDVGSTIGGASAKPSRMQYAFFTNALQRHIQDELARNREVKQIDYRVVVKVWARSTWGWQAPVRVRSRHRGKVSSPSVRATSTRSPERTSRSVRRVSCHWAVAAAASRYGRRSVTSMPVGVRAPLQRPRRRRSSFVAIWSFST
jgi:protein TonB